MTSTTPTTTTRLETTTDQGTPRPGSGARGRLLLSGAAATSAGSAALAAVWVARPDWSGYADPTSTLLRTWLTTSQVGLVHLALALAGLIAGLAGLVSTRDGAAWPRWLLPVGLVLGAGGALGLLGVQVIMGAGYGMAVLVPLAALLVTVQLVRRGGPGRWAALAGAGVVAATAVYVAQQPGIGRLGELLSRVVVEWPQQMAAPYWVLGTALIWLGVAARVMRNAGLVRGATAFVLRHRRAITVLAALGPLPYALVRLTWLTPWQLLAPTDGMTTDMRVWGIMLSLGAWAGFVLTLGLIRPWSEVFPRWMPWVADRPVPVCFAAVPGGLVAGVLCASAVPILVMLGDGTATTFLVSAAVFPLWLWGPALALAVWGYVLHRRPPRR